ncbi:MAG: YbaK/EbsC family protein [Candidatus Nanopelagicales bacterium]
MPKRGAIDTAATQQLIDNEVPYAVHQYGNDDEPTQIPTVASSRQRAIEMGIDPTRVLHTELAMSDGEPVITAVPASAVLDSASLAAAVGAAESSPADSGDIKKLTGYKQEDLSILGLRQHLPTVIDAAALDFPTVVISAGRYGYVIELSPDDLVRLTNARTAPIGRVL